MLQNVHLNLNTDITLVPILKSCKDVRLQFWFFIVTFYDISVLSWQSRLICGEKWSILRKP